MMVHEFPPPGRNTGNDDMTEATAIDDPDVEVLPVDSGEALFPSAEELRSSYTSRNSSSRNVVGSPSSSSPRGPTNTKKKNRWLWTMLFVLPLVVLLVIVPAVVISQNNKEETSSASSSQPRATYDEIVNFMVQNDVSSNSTFADFDSPQSRAARWLAEDDGAALPLPDADLTLYDGYMYMFRYVMAVNYFALGGPSWDAQLGFLSAADVCEWNDLVVIGNKVPRLGVRCIVTGEGDNRAHVPYLLYLIIQLVGEIPAENGKLYTLNSLRFQLNDYLIGTIPSELCGLTNLVSLALNHNILSGEIPSCLGTLPFLRELLLSSNGLDGSVPVELGTLGNTLQFLYLDDNMLSGDPTNVFNELTNLIQLYANNNEFEATLDSTFLNKVSTLNWVDLSANMFAGSFPTHLFRHEFLNVLDFTNNQLTGEFGDIEKNDFVQLLSVYKNSMSGSLSSLSNLTKLIHLDISDNQFTGPMEPIGELKFLVNLFLSENSLLKEGPIPSSFTNLTLLEELSIRNTNRNGELLDSIGENLKKLVLLDLSSNKFNDTIPDSFGELPDLAFLLLNNNPGISGSLPTSFGNMTQLRGVFLDGTSIDGDEAVELLCTLPNFENNITGAEVVIVDCAGICDTCNGCQCCEPNGESGCSEPLLGNFDATWVLGFQRPPYEDFELRNENATSPDGDRNIRS